MASIFEQLPRVEDKPLQNDIYSMDGLDVVDERYAARPSNIDGPLPYDASLDCDEDLYAPQRKKFPVKIVAIAVAAIVVIVAVLAVTGVFNPSSAKDNPIAAAFQTDVLTSKVDMDLAGQHIARGDEVRVLKGGPNADDQYTALVNGAEVKVNRFLLRSGSDVAFTPWTGYAFNAAGLYSDYALSVHAGDLAQGEAINVIEEAGDILVVQRDGAVYYIYVGMLRHSQAQPTHPEVAPAPAPSGGSSDSSSNSVGNNNGSHTLTPVPSTAPDPTPAPEPEPSEPEIPAPAPAPVPEPEPPAPEPPAPAPEPEPDSGDDPGNDAGADPELPPPAPDPEPGATE